MSVLKKCKVVMLSTKEQANIFLEENITLTYYKYQQKHSLKGIAMNLYILSDDEIKEGDWYYDYMLRVVLQATKTSTHNGGNDYKKIVATTDTSLHTTECVDGSELMDEWQGEKIDLHTELPQLSESFIQAYIKAYNEGKHITEVDLEMDIIKNENYTGNGDSLISGYKIKTRPDNTVIVHQSKMYSREELISLCKKAYTEGYGDLSEWIEENL